MKTKDPLLKMKKGNEKQLISFKTNFISVINYDTQMKIEAEMYNKDGRWNCKTCQYNSKSNAHLREHVQTHMDLEFPCTVCGKIMRSSTALRMHHKRFHLMAY